MKFKDMSLKQIIKELVLFSFSTIQRNHKSKILFYHDVFETINYKAADANICMGTSLQLFKQHIEVIRQEGYEIVSKITEEENQVCIMFDDGFRGIYECRQYFYDNNFQPTIFLAVDLIGKPGFLTIKEILELQEHGFIFECHTWSHKNLTLWSKLELKKELYDSMQFLSKLLCKEVDEICLPLGYYNKQVLDEIKKYNYKVVYSSIPGNYNDQIDYNMVTRNLVQFSTPNEVRYILRGGYNFLKNRYKKIHCLD